MTPLFIAGLYTAIENTRVLANSALPNAPVIADGPTRSHRRPHIGARVGPVLRSLGLHALNLADRVDPHVGPQATKQPRASDPLSTG